jgi:hypothetical protein
VVPNIPCFGFISGEIMMAATGNPLPMPFAIVYISASTPAWSCEKNLPVLP